MCHAKSQKRSAKGSNFKEDDMALPLWELLLYLGRHMVITYKVSESSSLFSCSVLTVEKDCSKFKEDDRTLPLWELLLYLGRHMVIKYKVSESSPLFCCSVLTVEKDCSNFKEDDRALPL